MFVTWTAETKAASGSGETTVTDGVNLLAMVSLGHFSWEGSGENEVGWESHTDYTDAEALIGVLQHGRLLDYVSGTEGESVIWTAESQQSTSWTRELRADNAGAFAAGSGGAGGTIWTAESKDS